MSDKLREALKLAVRTARAMVYICGHPRGSCPKHCDLLVKVIDSGEAALAESGTAPAVGQLSEEQVQQVILRNTVQLDNRDGKLMGRHPASLPIMQFNRMADDFNALLRSEAAKELDKKL